MTGGLDDQLLRELSERLTYLRNLESRKEEVKSLIEKMCIRDRCGILTGDCYDILRNYSDVICEIIPEMYPCIGFEQHSKYHDKTVYGHIAATVAAAEPTVEARLTMLLHDIGKPDSFFMKDGEMCIRDRR